jgi:hypothetical protein
VSDGPAAADHLSLDALAELQEGIADDADALRRHLDGCADCRARAGQLHTSRALLSALPTDSMPADVAARIDAALAAEAHPANLRGDIVPLRGRRSWLRGPNLAAAAAGVAVLALGSALAVGHLGGKSAPAANDAKTVSGATAPHQAAPNNILKQWQTGANYNDANRAGLVAGLVLRNPPPFPTGGSLGAEVSPQPTPPSGPNVTSSSKTSYSRVALRAPAIVFACAALLAGHPVQPLAVDYARYAGAPAVLLVLPSLTNPTGELDVYVIRTACSDGANDIGFFRVARPH